MWRTPAEESLDLYPGLVVHDGRVTGSITAGRTRLPLWAFVPEVVHRGWGDIAEHYPSADEVGAQGLAAFLYDLLEARGEFARLLLAIADAHRREFARAEAALDEHWETIHGPTEKVCDCGAPDPPPWWEDEELYGTVADLLRRCLDLLEGNAQAARSPCPVCRGSATVAACQYCMKGYDGPWSASRQPIPPGGASVVWNDDTGPSAGYRKD